MDEIENINKLCRVCLRRKAIEDMVIMNQSQIEKLTFIGDSNEVILWNINYNKLRWMVKKNHVDMWGVLLFAHYVIYNWFVYKMKTFRETDVLD